MAAFTVTVEYCISPSKNEIPVKEASHFMVSYRCCEVEAGKHCSSSERKTKGQKSMLGVKIMCLYLFYVFDLDLSLSL